MWVVCRGRIRIDCRRTAPDRGWNAEGGQMHSIRIIGPGRAGRSLAAALSARGWAFAGFLGRDDDLSGAARGVDVLVIATPDDTIAEVAAARRARRRHDGRASLGFARSRCAGAPPAPRRPPSAGAAPERRGGCRSPGLGRDVRGGGRARRPRDRRTASAGVWSRWPTRIAPPTTPPPAWPPTTWSHCWGRSSGSPPRSGSTSSRSCRSRAPPSTTWPRSGRAPR